jgi:hypothetical protein
MFGAWWMLQRAVNDRGVLTRFDQGEVVDGTVTESYRGYSGRDDGEPPHSEYEFTTLVGDRIQGEGEFYEPVGSIIKVEYVPDDPQLNRMHGDDWPEGAVRTSLLIASTLACIGLWALGEAVLLLARRRPPTDRQVLILQGALCLTVIATYLPASWWLQDNVWEFPDGLLGLPFVLINLWIVIGLCMLLMRVVVPKQANP